MRKIKKRTLFFVFVFLFFLCLTVLFFQTGILQNKSIDKRDLAFWKYNDSGVIAGAEEFILEGKNETCWYLIHGYTSTPDEMKEIAENLKQEFQEKIIVTRLKGHGEVPSHIVNLTLDDWYAQVSSEFDELKKDCHKINLVGFSFGGALATRLAETKKVNNVYLLSPYLFATYHPYYIFKLETYLDFFGNFLIYAKKQKIGQINDPEGLKKHIAYWNMPFKPIKNSKAFFKKVQTDLKEITAPILLQQSKNDEASDFQSSVSIYQNVNSSKRELISFEKSNHIIPEDYDKKTVIQNIINFEKETGKK